MEKILPAGPSKPILAEDDKPVLPEPLSSRATLYELANDYRLFSIGALFTQGYLIADPCQDWVNDKPGRAVCRWELPVPVVYGLDPVYDRCLWGVDHASWPELLIFLQTITGVKRQTYTVWTALAQRIRVLDVLSPTVDPTAVVEIMAFGLSSNKGLYVFEPPVPFSLTRHPPAPQALTLAKALLGEESLGAQDVEKLYSEVIV